MNYAFYILPVLLAVSIPSAFAQVETGIFKDYDNVLNEDGTYTLTTHPPYIENWDGDFVPYRVIEDPFIVQVELNDGKLVFDKLTGAVTTFNNEEILIKSDSYVVRQAQLNSNEWNNLDINNESVSTTVEELDNGNIIVTFTRENFEGIFKVEYIVNIIDIKTTAYFTNNFYQNSKFAFTQTLELPDSIITLNDLEDIDLSNFVGQSFPRQVLEENEDLIFQIKNLYYNSGLGFDKLHNVSILENNKITLDYANVQETETAIGQTVELDPTTGFGGSFAGNTGFPHAPAQTVNHGTTINAISVSSVSYSASASTVLAKSGTIQVQAMIFHKDTNVNTYSSSNFICNTGKMSVAKYWHSAYGNPSASCTISSPNQSEYLSNLSNGSTLFGLGGDQQSSGLGFSTYQKNLSVSYTYVAPTVPTAPQSLTTSQSVANEIILNWSAPTSDGNSAITNYKIYLDGTLIDTIGNVLTYTDSISGNEIGAGLTYKVVAVNSVGDSPDSNNSFITAWDVPDAPTGFQAITGSPISMSWVTPYSDDTITNYKIYRDSSLIDTISPANSYTDNTTVSGNSYTYEISAVSAVGESALSSSSTAIHGLPWNPPGSVSAVISDPDNSPFDISVSWSGSTQGSGTGTLTGYELWRTNGATTVLVSTLGNVLTYTDTVSLANTNFEYFVKSTSTHGTSGNSPVSNTVTTPTTPGSPSLTLAINDPNNLPLNITSTFVDGPTGGSAITGFNLYYSSDDITYSSIVNNTNSDYIYSVSNAGTHYFKSEAINTIGTGTLSTAFSINTPNAPDAITDLSGSVRHSN
jgi:hypothetical protein